jgi:phosphoribosyl 1,2-cyclic phosphodiesterase
MKLWVLGSGSRGNAVLVESGECRLLIDIGFGPRVLQRRLESIAVAPESVEACVITHEHSDHARGAARAARRWHWPLFATDGTYRNSRLFALGTHAGIIASGTTISFSGMDVTTFRTPHDAVEPIGVVVTERSSGVRAAICTDLGYGSQTVRKMISDVDILLLESNHDDVMLANGPYPLSVQRRIASRVGHLSNRECAQLVKEAITPRLRQVVLAHVSANNNTPQIAFDNMRTALKGTRFRGLIAPSFQDSVVGPISLRTVKAETQLTLPL